MSHRRVYGVGFSEQSKGERIPFNLLTSHTKDISLLSGVEAARLTARSSLFRVSRRAPGCLKQREGCLDQAPEPPTSHRLFRLIGYVQGGEAMHHGNEEIPRLLWREI